jgi:hypothetical protein
MRRSTVVAAFALLSFTAMTAQTPPAPITLSNGLVSLDVQRPDAATGFYRGTRFDWSGVISRLEYAGHRYYGPWFARSADVRDYVWDGDQVVAGAASSVTGPADEFSTNGRGLGFDDAKPGETFVKIGVGVLRRPDESAYSMFRAYEVVDHGTWQVASTPASATFTHALNDAASGYGYVYEKTVSLAASAPVMTITHRIRNTGRKPVDSRVYNHNFLVLDGQPTGPDFVITLPFAIQTSRPPDAAMAAVDGPRVTYRAVLQPKQTVSVPIEGFGPTADHYGFSIENTKMGAGMRVTGDRPIASVSLWSIRPTIAVEPFIAFSIAPGETFTWQYVYTYYTLPARTAG